MLQTLHHWRCTSKPSHFSGPGRHPCRSCPPKQACINVGLPVCIVLTVLHAGGPRPASKKLTGAGCSRVASIYIAASCLVSSGPFDSRRGPASLCQRSSLDRAFSVTTVHRHTHHSQSPHSLTRPSLTDASPEYLSKSEQIPASIFSTGQEGGTLVSGQRVRRPTLWMPEHTASDPSQPSHCCLKWCL